MVERDQRLRRRGRLVSVVRAFHSTRLRMGRRVGAARRRRLPAQLEHALREPRRHAGWNDHQRRVIVRHLLAYRPSIAIAGAIISTRLIYTTTTTLDAPF